MGFPHTPQEKGWMHFQAEGVNFSRSSQYYIWSVFILCFHLLPAPSRLQLILYSDEEVRAALEPLRTIPAFTQLLLTDPPAAPKQKCDKPAGDPMSQSQPDVPAEKVTGGDAKSPMEDKPVRASDPATPTVPIETGKDHDKEQAHDTGIGAKPKAPSRKPRKAGKLAPAMEKGKILGKPPHPRPGPIAASLIPPLPDVLSMFMGCNTPDEFSSLSGVSSTERGMVSLPCPKAESMSVCCILAGHRLSNGVYEHTFAASNSDGNDSVQGVFPALPNRCD